MTLADPNPSKGSTTGEPPKAGTCPKCGNQLYAGLTHSCTTGVSLSASNPEKRPETCPFCLQPLHDGRDLYRDERGITAHTDCHDMDRSAAFGDWITWEYE
jgi:hypothetical protein